MKRTGKFELKGGLLSPLLTLLLCLNLLGLPAPFAFSQTKQAREDQTKNLEKIETELNQAKKHEDELVQQRERLAEETIRLRTQLIASAARLQAREAQATATEIRLGKLTTKETGIKKHLIVERGKLAELLAGLQRIERSPPPALAVQPQDALKAARSALLLGAIIPEIKQEANALSQALYNLNTLRKEIGIEQSDLLDTRAKLSRERTRMSSLLEAKRSAFQLANKEITIERRRVRRLGEKAKSLKDLLAGLQTPDTQKEEAEKYTPLKLARLTPAVRFTKNKKALSFPVQGEQLKNFGDSDGFGGKVNGLSIASRPLAQVISPNDGTIVYAGEFRGYGELLIINAGEGYHVLLAGMKRITAEVGQFVLAGEPVGSMGESAARSAALGATVKDDRPILYVEFRRKGRSLDPTPWWAGNVKKARG